MPFGAQSNVEPALPRGAVDRLVKIQLIGGAFAGEATKPPKRDLDVAGSKLDIIVEIPELPLVPDLDRAPVAAAFLADSDAFGIISISAEGRGAGGADPFVAALVPALLFLEPLLQRLHDLFPRPERLDLLHLLRCEIKLGHLAQPFLGNRRGACAVIGLKTLEDFRED